MTKTVFSCPSVCILSSYFLSCESCDLVSKNLNVEEDSWRNRIWARMIHLSISLCFQHLNKKKIVIQLLLMVFCDNVSKNQQFLSQIPRFHQTSIENLGELISLSKKNIGFTVLVIGFSHSKFSDYSPTYKEIRVVRIYGVVQTYMQHFRQAFGTG